MCSMTRSWCGCPGARLPARKCRCHRGPHWAVYGPSQRTKRRATTRPNTNQRRVFPLAGAILVAVIRRHAWPTGICCQSDGPCPRRAGRSPRCRLRALLRLGRVGPGVASPRPPEGLPHGSPGAEPDDARIGYLRAAPGLPCGRAAPDRRDATQPPACKICDPAVR
jgi:hypothetical protein